MIEPDDHLEEELMAEGYEVVAGVDEVGRGAWAGPVSVGVVVVPAGVASPRGLRDSKLVPEARRGALCRAIIEWSPEWSVGHAGPEECDRFGMTAALGLAGQRAIAQLPIRPQVLLLDGPFDYLTDRAAPGAGPEVRTVVRGDTTSVAIAAASIVAKVTRDAAMRELAASFPWFDFERNKGYPSPAHRRALLGMGLSAIHRRSWSYVDTMLAAPAPRTPRGS